MPQAIEKIYGVIYDAYANETDCERKAMYDNALTVLANLDIISPELAW
jgi:hypothetical protein